MMPDLPIIKPRDMAAHLAGVADTHRQIMQRIHEHAAEHETLHSKQNEKLNAEMPLRGH